MLLDGGYLNLFFTINFFYMHDLWRVKTIWHCQGKHLFCQIEMYGEVLLTVFVDFLAQQMNLLEGILFHN